MIYSIKQNAYIPVQVTKEIVNGAEKFVRYDVRDKDNLVGFVDLQDTPNGCYVLFIHNEKQNSYKGFGKLADQIEVEHCIHRNIKNPIIASVSKFSAHIANFKRGKRFVNEGINILLQEVLNHLKIGERVNAGYLGNQPMFMPQNLVHKYIEIIKKAPILK